jgi:superfamily II DNA/RNA helicase
VVGTPGRIIDHLERGTFDTSNIKYLVIDEADEMLNMGFIEQIETILTHLPQEHVTMLFSATMPLDISNLCSKYMKDPVYVEIEDQSKTSDRIIQERYDTTDSDKVNLLSDVTVIENPESCIIFCNTKQRVEEVHFQLARLNYSCNKIHGDMEQSDRFGVMNDFKQGYFRYLIATDIAARGIDIDDVNLVINYDVPRDSEIYVHRIGRTGRIGKMGKAITFVSQNDSKLLKAIERYIGNEIPIKTRPDNDDIKNARSDFTLTNSSLPEIKVAKGAQLNKNILKIHINAGKKTKMRPVDIVGTLCSIDGMSAADIGIISVQDVSTFVDILNDKGEMVYQELQNRPIKGRLRKVSKAEARKL